MWIHLKHPNIIPLYGIDRTRFSGTPCMVMPWAEDSNIINYMKGNDKNKDKEAFGAADINKWVSACSFVYLPFLWLFTHWPIRLLILH